MRKTARLGNQRGFTFIELLVVLIILIILAGIIVLSVGNVFGRARSFAYVSVKEQVQTAVTAYHVKSLGTYPLTGSTTVIDGNTLDIIDACALLANVSSGGTLRAMPDGFVSIPGSDNCASQAYNCSCDAKAHYIWAVDTSGNVRSSCINTLLNEGGCANTGQDGFQNIWP